MKSPVDPTPTFRCLQVPAVAALALLLPSCAVLDDTGLSTATGAGVGSLVGGAVAGDGNRTEGAIIGGLVGGIVGYTLSKNYQANQQQIAAAKAAGYRASRDASIQKTKTRYVAVPVPNKTGSGKDVMVYDTTTKEVASDKAYVSNSGTSYKKGDQLTVGGKRAVVASAFQGV